MKYAIIPLLLLFQVAYGQNNESENPLFQKSLNRDSIRADFATLYNLTNTIHPGEFMFCRKQEFDKCYDSLKNSIQSDISVVEYYKITATLMAKIKDGHTVVDRGNISTLLKDQLTFPYNLYKINDAYYLNKTPLTDNNLSGCKVLKINGKDIHAIIKTIRSYLCIEGENETAINSQLMNFPFYYFIYEQSEIFEIEYEEGQTSKTIRLKGVEFPTFYKAVYEKQEPLSTDFFNNKIAILKVRTFSNGYNDYDRKIAEEQLDAFFSKLDSLKTTDLILDLRGNSGGAPEMANDLFSYLTNKPYYYFAYIGMKYNSVKEWKHFAQFPNKIDEIDLSQTKIINGLNCYTPTTENRVDYWYFEKQQNKPNYFKGNIHVLINGGCFSTTGHLLALMRNYSIGTFYGEYSQGSNYSNSGMQAFIMPYSKTLVWIPFMQFKMNTPKFKYDPKGIKPDVELEKEPNDLKKHFDRIQDYVIQKIETRK
jgi:hypothetical protein